MRHYPALSDRRAPYASRAAVLSVSLLISVSVGACSDETGETISQPAAHHESEKPPAQRLWLDAEEATRPEVWLVSRMANGNTDPNSPELARTATLLDTAAHKFRESSRMIANRAVQLEGMLAEIGATEPAHELIEKLSRITADDRNGEGFGALCQHYFNLRASGLDRDGALADLERRYGEQR